MSLLTNLFTKQNKEQVKQMKNLSLKWAWGLRLKLRAEGNKLYAEGNKLRAEGDKLYAEGNKLRAEGGKLRAEGNKLYAEGDKLCAEGNKLCAEGDKLRAEGNKLWAEAIIEVHGNIKLEWENWDSNKNDHECHLETGEVFKPSDVYESGLSEDEEEMIKKLEAKGRIVKDLPIKKENAEQTKLFNTQRSA